MATWSEVGLLRLVAQRIAGPGLGSPADVVQWLAAVQAQDLSGAITSVAMRTGWRQRGAVEDALDAGKIVRSWPMRGTLHLVVAEDLPWMLETMAARVVAGAGSRRAALGLDSTALDRARQVAVSALAGGRRLRRDELYAAWEDDGLATAGGRGYHLLAHLAQTGTLCFGPVADGEQLIVLVEEWIPRPRRLERDEACGELADRFFRSHGPATVKDLTRWTNLVAADARAGLARARPNLARIDVDGIEHFLAPETQERLDRCRGQAKGVFLLPGFDELVLGYQDRRASLPAEFASHICPGANGVFRATVVSDGQVVGTWKHAGRGAKRRLAATPFTTWPEEVVEASTAAYAALP